MKGYKSLENIQYHYKFVCNHMWKQEGKHFVYSTYNMVSVSRKCSTPRTMSSRDLCMGFSSTVLLRVVCPKKSTGTTKVLARDNLVKNWFFFHQNILDIQDLSWFVMAYDFYLMRCVFSIPKPQRTKYERPRGHFAHQSNTGDKFDQSTINMKSHTNIFEKFSRVYYIV